MPPPPPGLFWPVRDQVLPVLQERQQSIHLKHFYYWWVELVIIIIVVRAHFDMKSFLNNSAIFKDFHVKLNFASTDVLLKLVTRVTLKAY